MKKTKENIASMFNSIAGRYDLLNHLLSLNSDKRWRKILTRSLNIDENSKLLDIATGTGDLALELSKRNPGKVTGIDIAERMLEIAKDKAYRAGMGNLIDLQVARAENLPFDDDDFDFITVAFGVRNFEDLDKGLKEMHRVLKPKGTAAILEFSKPEGFIFSRIYDLYFRGVLPLAGKIISNNDFAYDYLHDSVEAFPYGNKFLDQMSLAGFKEMHLKKLTFGVCTIYYGHK